MTYRYIFYTSFLLLLVVTILLLQNTSSQIQLKTIEVKQKQEKYDILAIEKKSLDGKVSGLDGQIKSFENRVEDLNEQVKNLNEQVKNLNEQVKNLNGEKQKLIEEKSQEIIKLNSEKNKKVELEKEIDKQNKQINENEQQKQKIIELATTKIAIFEVEKNPPYIEKSFNHSNPIIYHLQGQYDKLKNFPEVISQINNIYKNVYNKDLGENYLYRGLAFIFDKNELDMELFKNYLNKSENISGNVTYDLKQENNIWKVVSSNNKAYEISIDNEKIILSISKDGQSYRKELQKKTIVEKTYAYDNTNDINFYAFIKYEFTIVLKEFDKLFSENQTIYVNTLIELEKSKQELEKTKQELEKSKQELERSKQEPEKSKQG